MPTCVSPNVSLCETKQRRTSVLLCVAGYACIYDGDVVGRWRKRARNGRFEYFINNITAHYGRCRRKQLAYNNSRGGNSILFLFETLIKYDSVKLNYLRRLNVIVCKSCAVEAKIIAQL